MVLVDLNLIFSKAGSWVRVSVSDLMFVAFNGVACTIHEPEVFLYYISDVLLR